MWDGGWEMGRRSLRFGSRDGDGGMGLEKSM